MVVFGKAVTSPGSRANISRSTLNSMSLAYSVAVNWVTHCTAVVALALSFAFTAASCAERSARMRASCASRARCSARFSAASASSRASCASRARCSASLSAPSASSRASSASTARICARLLAACARLAISALATTPATSTSTSSIPSAIICRRRRIVCLSDAPTNSPMCFVGWGFKLCCSTSFNHCLQNTASSFCSSGSGNWAFTAACHASASFFSSACCLWYTRSFST
mmetsp:Transcript_21430/g.54976  ORF Transcript_21430/g.54976 Transcript_21430/m.54976 type:complete len:229 (-) Transcript_21430:596-1282(-)